jgi:DNA-binding NarL/FixJ family response regulator
LEQAVREAVTILCVDDHPLVREGIASVVNAQRDMRVVAFAGNGVEAVDAFRTHRPDVTLMDLQLPVMNGIDAIRGIRSIEPDARVIVLTMFRGDEDIYQCLDAGATTYLLKETLSRDLVRVIRDVHSGARPIPDEVARRLAERQSRSTLTSREVAVLRLVAAGKHNREIASGLGISEETVHSHLKNIFAKWNVRDRREAMNLAIRRGIVHLE